MRLLRAASLGLLIALALSACVPTKVTRSPQELAAAQHAEQLVSQGQFDQAVQAYLDLARQTGDTDHYNILAAEVYRGIHVRVRAAGYDTITARASTSFGDKIIFGARGLHRLTRQASAFQNRTLVAS